MTTFTFTARQLVSLMWCAFVNVSVLFVLCVLMCCEPTCSGADVFAVRMMSVWFQSHASVTPSLCFFSGRLSSSPVCLLLIFIWAFVSSFSFSVHFSPVLFCLFSSFLPFILFHQILFSSVGSTLSSFSHLVFSPHIAASFPVYRFSQKLIFGLCQIKIYLFLLSL